MTIDVMSQISYNPIIFTNTNVEFDITHLDRKKLIHALFAYAQPRSWAATETSINHGAPHGGLSEEECESLLMGYWDIPPSMDLRLNKTIKGKSLDIVFSKRRNTRLLVDTESYDSVNGKYCFLEAMFNAFPLHEILITKKGYSQALVDFPDHLSRSKQEKAFLRKLMKATVRRKDWWGIHWCFDEQKVLEVAEGFHPPKVLYIE